MSNEHRQRDHAHEWARACVDRYNQEAAIRAMAFRSKVHAPTTKGTGQVPDPSGLEERSKDKEDMSLPEDNATRKMIRPFSGAVQYFPDAIAAVAYLSKMANEQHNPGQPMHWAKEKSTEELDSLMNHLIDIASKGPTSRDSDGVLDAIKVAWRGLANLQRLADSGVNLFSLKD